MKRIGSTVVSISLYLHRDDIGYWAGFGFKSTVMASNTNTVSIFFGKVPPCNSFVALSALFIIYWKTGGGVLGGVLMDYR